jgi:hypothetical protein
MWRKETKEYETIWLPKVIEFTGCHISYGTAMKKAVTSWKYCIEHHLTDNSINQKAYIGHAACNIEHGWPEYLVREAWGYLNESQQMLANKAAENAINLWKQNTNTNAKTLFD